MNILQYKLNWLGNVMVDVFVSSTVNCRFDTGLVKPKVKKIVFISTSV